ncbi:sigma-70 family RNA polymerase sigma factor [Siculibacillus lacustris]|uniref:Sigma-70 family RNA polymerase sigma factor n=1 Tax=Siculibacillus lacustris TaxID=1549641 RepID=A0A4Q9VV45_9HYPH|nr:sigma-70 family RNA polymerase sigma factor [Siculibacillus lacustris]TBW40076.1 sigma-70 family RNA polymerase sigma factor [Siculibacillus lacustris]
MPQDSPVPLADRHAALAARVAASADRQAFAELFDHFAPRLKAHLMRNGCDAATAEELAQEVLAVLWTKAGLFDPAKSSLATWLHRIARNRRIDAVRHAKVRDFDDEEPMLQPQAPESAEVGLDRRRLEVRVGAALDGLPEEQRRLVRLAFFDELSHSEIAGVTGLPLGTVKSRLRLAFGRLRQALEALGGAV